MSPEMGPVVTGIGMRVPERVVTNREISQVVDTSDAWIVKRTGIRERRYASESEATSDLAIAAAMEAIKDSGIEAAAIDEVVVATATPNHLFPSTAVFVQEAVGARRAAAMDVSAACSGFLFALEHAYRGCSAGVQNTALVIGAETLSKFVGQDRATKPLFGDGAGAVVVENRGGPGVFAFVRHTDGSQAHLISIPGGGSRFPTTSDTLGANMHYIQMDGPKVYEMAVKHMTEASEEVLRKAGVKAKEVKLLVPHQANIRIMEKVASNVGLKDKLFSNIHKYGNTSAGSIPIALYEAYKSGKLRGDDLVVMVAFGAGTTTAAAVIQWYIGREKRGFLKRIFKIGWGKRN